MTQSTAKAASRILGLDVLRGLAVVLMMQQHLGVWLWVGPNRAQGETPMDYPLLLALNALGGGAAPMFIILAGIGCSLLGTRRTVGVDRTLVLRGFALMGFGYLLNILTPSWFSWRSWYVLHLMGLGMLLTPALRRLSSRSLLILATVVVALGPTLQTLLDTPTYMSNTRMAGWAGGGAGSEVLAGGHLRLAAVEGQFPIFPWLALFLGGLVAGRWVVAQRLRALLLCGGILAATGGVMLGLYALRVPFATAYQRVFGFNIPFFPCTVSTLLVVAGLVLLAITALFALERRRPFSSGNVMVCLGRASLTLLLVHVWLFREIRPWGLWKNLAPGEVAMVMVGIIAAATLGAWWWKRIGFRFGAEWLVRVIGSR